MRNLPAALNDALAKEATTLATCWILRRRDGRALGFTDHDAPLMIDGISCEAATGFEPTAATTELGLSPDNQQIAGALSAAAITAEDLERGIYDGASVEVWLVDWSNASEASHHLRSFILGEVTRSDEVFSAELRGITSLLDRPIGRQYNRGCDASLGDTRCGVDLTNPLYRTAGQVISVNGRLHLETDMPDDFEAGWFVDGVLRWTDGANAGLTSEVSRHAGHSLSLWQAPPLPVVAGDAFELTAGCDKAFGTCRAKFSNAAAFRGFPHMPGGDFSLGYADRDTLHDGSPLVD